MEIQKPISLNDPSTWKLIEDETTIRNLVANGESVNNDGYPFIVWCSYLKPELLPVLIELGADVNCHDRDGRLTPLMIVAQKPEGCLYIEPLMKAGAKISVTTIDDRTSTLMWAMHEVHNRTDTTNLEALLKNGADINYRGEKGPTALMSACENSNAKHVKVLLNAGADVNVVDAWGRTALHYVFKKSQVNALQITKLLLDSKRDYRWKFIPFFIFLFMEKK